MIRCFIKICLEYLCRSLNLKMIMETVVKPVGSVVFFMENNKPVKGEIKGIATYTGECDNVTGDAHKTAEGETETIYHFDNFKTADSDKCFDTLEELKADLFASFEV